MDEELTSLQESLESFDAVDLASGVGGLQLLAVNAERQLRLERAAALVCSLEPEDGRPQMSAGRWRTLMNTSPIGSPRILSAEDPSENAFTDSVTFVGGSYTVFRGIVDESAEIARLLLRALFLSDDALPEAFVNEMQALTYSVLQLSEAVATRARIPRNTLPDSDREQRLVIPASDKFAQLKAAVTFQAEDLAELLRPEGIETLEPIVLRPFGQQVLDPDKEKDLAQVYVRPIVSDGSTYVVLVPSGLLVALRHRIVTRASELGLREELSEGFGQATLARVDRSLVWMGWTELPQALRDAPRWAAETFWSFDNDKIAHVLVMADDLESYADDPFNDVWLPDAAELESRIIEARGRVLTSLSEIRKVFHVVVSQSLGRHSFLPITDRVLSDKSETLLITQPDLAVISRFEAGDPLALWKFAHASSILRNSTAVISWSVLDEYGVYRGARHSFYLSDDGLPDLVSITTDFGADLRKEDAERFDFHGAVTSDGIAITDVQRRWSGTDAPVYTPEPLPRTRVEFLIEGPPLPIWVSESMEDTSAEGPRRLIFELCDTISYWLWQASESLRPVLEALRETQDAVRISVRILDPEDWDDWNEGQTAGEWLSVTPLGEDSLEVSFSPAAQGAFFGDDNAGERELLSRLTGTLQEMAHRSGRGDIALDIDQLIDEHAPLGPKKKILILDPSANTELSPGRLPRARTLQEVDNGHLLDTVGHAVTEILGLSTGEIPADSRVTVVNAIVGLHLDEIEQMIGDLRPEGLLENLVGYHEAIVRARAEHRLMMPTQIACFGVEPSFVAELQQHLADLTRADIALRFLIEYVTAQPPTGDRDLSLETFDRLMALSDEIVSKGMLSDAIYYGFGDVDLAILASGRLGIDREGDYLGGIEVFRPVKARHDTEASQRYFGSHWPNVDAIERPDSIDDLDAATLAEFGLTMTELAELIGELINIGIATDEEPKTMLLSEIVDLLAEELESERDKVQLGIEQLSLRAKGSFLDLPEGVSAADLYPWRFNRDLSYVRRPLLIRESAGKEELVWGIRHLDRVGPNILGLIQSGRLKARSTEMRRYVGSMRTEEAEAFNDEVADLFEARDDLVVMRRVDRFGSLRIERSPGQPLGDVDVLLVDTRRKHLQAIETKDLEQARTPAELSNELDKLFHGDDSAVSRHSERLSWLNEHLSDVLAWLDIEADAVEWRVEGQIVVSRLLVTPLFEESPIPVQHVQELRDQRDGT